MLKIVALSFFSLFSISVLARNCSVPMEELFLEIIRQDMTGARMSDRPKCFHTQQFKHILKFYDPGNEGVRSFDKIVDSNTLSINSVKLVNKDINLYKVNFSAYFGEDGKVDKISDIAEIIIHPSKKIQKLEGCAEMYNPPKKIYIDRSCVK